MIFCCNHRRGSFWFRIYGYGLAIQRYKYSRPLFSERNGYNKPILKIGNWFRVFTLKPTKLRRSYPRLQVIRGGKGH